MKNYNVPVQTDHIIIIIIYYARRQQCLETVPFRFQTGKDQTTKTYAHSKMSHVIYHQSQQVQTSEYITA